MDDGMRVLLEAIAHQAWAPTLGTMQMPDGNGGYTNAIVPQESPLLAAVARQLAHEVKEDPEIRAILIEGLRQAVTTPEWIESLRRALPDVAIKGQTQWDRAGMPDWVKEALIAHFTEWLDTEDSDDLIERMLSQSTITVQVERASAEPRRMGSRA